MRLVTRHGVLRSGQECGQQRLPVRGSSWRVYQREQVREAVGLTQDSRKDAQ